MSFFSELNRRNVIRVGAAYVVASWLVIQVVATIFPMFGLEDAAGRVVVVLLAIGFVPVLIFAWVFELTPSGIKREREVERSETITPQTGRKLDRMILVVLAVAVAYFTFDKFVLQPRLDKLEEQQQAEEVAVARQQGRSEALVESYGEKSIAVLPFADMSPDSDQEYFSDGIAEELLNLLAGIPELRVISRSSTFSFKGKNLEIPEIGRRLNVAHILEGSVRKAGNQVRITAQLIDAHSDTHLWSRTWDRTLDNIFAIQDEISALVVEELKVTLLGPASQDRVTDPEAYALYLQARHLSRQGSAGSFKQAIALFQQALAIAPDYAAAWDSLARIHITQAETGLAAAQEAFSLASEAANRALAINPNYAPAYATLGYIAMTFDELGVAAGYFGQALELDSTNPDILRYAAVLARSLGRLDDAINIYKYVVSRDPVNAQGYSNLGFVYIYAGRPDDALEAYRTALKLGMSPDYVGNRFFHGIALQLKGEPEAALEATQKESLEVYRLIGLVMAHWALDQQAKSDVALAELIDKYERDAAYNIAYVLAFRGEVDRAFEWLDKAVIYNDPGMMDIPVENLFANLHADPRWIPFLERIGKSPRQLAEISFRVTLPQTPTVTE